MIFWLGDLIIKYKILYNKVCIGYCILTKEPDYIVEQLKVGMEIDVKIKTAKNVQQPRL